MQHIKPRKTNYRNNPSLNTHTENGRKRRRYKILLTFGSPLIAYNKELFIGKMHTIG